jgi:hypothetical protein
MVMTLQVVPQQTTIEVSNGDAASGPTRQQLKSAMMLQVIL